MFIGVSRIKKEPGEYRSCGQRLPQFLPDHHPDSNSRFCFLIRPDLPSEGVVSSYTSPEALMVPSPAGRHPLPHPLPTASLAAHTTQPQPDSLPGEYAADLILFTFLLACFGSITSFCPGSAQAQVH